MARQKPPGPIPAPQDTQGWQEALEEDPDALAGLLRALVDAHGDVEPTADGLHDLVWPTKEEDRD